MQNIRPCLVLELVQDCVHLVFPISILLDLSNHYNKDERRVTMTNIMIQIIPHTFAANCKISPAPIAASS